MPITLPNLDDRRFADLVEEARQLLVAHAPALTNHNPSDPVVTLAELFAYFSEVLLFRVNNITDAQRVKYLRLLNGPDKAIPPSGALLDAEVRRTVLELRHTDRAVTPDDFVALALLADPQVARAYCLAERNLDAVDQSRRLDMAPGHVSVVIVPAASVDTDAKREALHQTVTDYLEPRRLLTTRVHVVAPRVVPIRVRLTVRLLPDATEAQVEPRVVDALTSFFDPIVGRGGTGWPLGRNVNVSEIYRLLDTVAGVDYVRRTRDGNEDLDELVTSADLETRLVRNADDSLIGIALEPDELAGYQPPADDFAADIVIEETTAT